MQKKVLIIENASTQAMRVKLLLELQNCEVDMVNEYSFVLDEYDQYYDMVVIEHSMPYALVEVLKDKYRFCVFLILAPSPDTLSSTKELVAIQMALTGSSVIYEFYTNKEILAEFESLLQLGEDASLPNLLLVDDNVERLVELKSVLSGANLTVATLDSPKSIKQFISSQDNIDILVSDFHMNDCTGIDVYREVKHRFKECQCILLTSRTHHSVLIEVIREGVREVLEKPVDQNLLFQSIHKIWQTQTLKTANQSLITRWQETLDVLVEHDILLQVLYNTTLDGVMVVDESGDILEVNNSCETLFGYAKNLLCQMRFDKMLTKESKVKLAKHLAQSANEQRFSIELDVNTSENLIVPIYVCFSKINYHGRRVYAGTIRDFSQFVDQREQLKRTKELLEVKVSQRTEALENAKNVAEQANSSKTEFLANMSHELRTPMHSILSFARFGIDMIASNKVNMEKLDKYYHRIVTSGNQLLRLLNNLLDLSKLNSGKFPFNPSESSLKEAVNQVIQEVSGLAFEKSIVIRFESDCTLDVIWCDAELIQQIVRNLLGNAMRFSPKKGTVMIKLSEGTIKRDGQLLKTAVIEVADHGVGIPDKEFKAIFNQFAQSSKTNRGAGGTGLGLAICKDLIGLHKGEIYAQNNDKGGATFIFKLPVSKTF